MSFNIGPMFWRVKIKEVTLTLASMKLVGCTTAVMLNAIVEVPPGDNIAAHRFEWELIAGDPIIWLEDQDQVSVTWQYPDDFRTDRTFRFWVDRGTNVEQFADILVTAIPRTTVDANATNGSLVDTTVSMISSPNSFPFREQDIYGYIVTPYTATERVVVWTPPVDPVATHYVVERFDPTTMSWIEYITTQSNAITVPSGVVQTIRVTAHSLYGGKTVTTISIPDDTADYIIPQTTVNPGASGGHSRVVSMISLTTLNPTTTTTSVNGSTSSTRIVQNFTLTVLPTNEVTVNLLDSSSGHSRVVQTFSGGSLG